jgi:hypothetical protein
MMSLQKIYKNTEAEGSEKLLSSFKDSLME